MNSIHTPATALRVPPFAAQCVATNVHNNTNPVFVVVSLAYIWFALFDQVGLVSIARPTLMNVPARLASTTRRAPTNMPRTSVPAPAVREPSY
jgi:hypothetical protein